MKQAHRCFCQSNPTRWIAGIALTLSSVCTCLGSKIDWLLTPKSAYLVLAPSLIGDGSVQHSAWSPNGAYLLVSQVAIVGPTINQILNYSPSAGATQPPINQPGPSILVWDRSRQQTRKIWSSEDSNVAVWNFAWLPNSNTAYVTLIAGFGRRDQPEMYCGVLAIDASSGHFAWVPGMDHLPRIPSIIPSPIRPLAVAIFDDRPVERRPQVSIGNTSVAGTPQGPGQQGSKPALPVIVPFGEYVDSDSNNFWTLGAQGQVIRRVQSPPSTWFGISWSKDGSKWFETTRNTQSKSIFIQEFDENGKLATVTADLYAKPKEQPAELILNTKPMIAKQRSSKHGFDNLWLSSPKETPHPDVLITPNGVHPLLSPTQDAVFYVESGIAKVRAFVALTDDQRKALYQALKTEAVSNAKQVGLGLLMYSSDCDDNLPSASAFGDIGPYLGDSSLMDDFNYTPPGDLATTRMENPATTELGSINGPGGRAVVYGDGHAKWIPNP